MRVHIHERFHGIPNRVQVHGVAAGYGVHIVLFQQVIEQERGEESTGVQHPSP